MALALWFLDGCAELPLSTLMLALLRLKPMVNSLLSEHSSRKRQELAEFSTQGVPIKD